MFEGVSKRLRAYAEKDGRGYPDWAVRYLPVLRGLEGRNLKADRILEIGANENGFARFARTRVVAVDVAFAHLQAARDKQDVAPVVADIAALPFAPGSFDVCVCMDTFEHIPAGSRGAAAGEIANALKSSGHGVVAFPCGAAAEGAERAVRDAYRAYAGRELRWLEEHVEQGLPDAYDMARLFEAAAVAHGVRCGKNANLRVWRWMWFVLMCGWPGRGNAVFQVILRLLTPLIARMHMGSCYRQVIWLEPK